jgi:hypothetical protein
MKIKWLFFVILMIIVFSCRKTISKEEENTNLDSISTNLLITKHREVKLNAKAKIVVEDWTEYNKMDDFLKQYHHISSIDALFNANELSELAQQLKDTIRVKKFEIPSVKIRLNVLYNETLRLADMATINNISEQEIYLENENILNAFSALNLKINNIIIQESLNDDVSKFVEEIKNSSNSDPQQEKPILVRPKKDSSKKEILK